MSFYFTPLNLIIINFFNFIHFAIYPFIYPFA